MRVKLALMHALQQRWHPGMFSPQSLDIVHSQDEALEDVSDSSIQKQLQGLSSKLKAFVSITSTREQVDATNVSTGQM
jgi:hypothetical protein